MTHEPISATHQPDLHPFDFRPLADPTDPDVRWSTWGDLEPLMRGPEPRPSWVVTSAGALDTDLGVPKTGKEADVHLLERHDPYLADPPALMAAKRYRAPEHRSFQRATAYTEGRSVRRSRDQRALDRGSTWGRQVAAAEWATSEWSMLVRCWSRGVPVPYPVQIDGTEILMELVTTGSGEVAPRLAASRPAPDLLPGLFEQVREAMGLLVEDGLVHGDLSPYNILLAEDRLVLIDLPQAVDLYGNPRAMEFLERDCTIMCRWFTSRGLPVDPHDLLAELIARGY